MKNYLWLALTLVASVAFAQPISPDLTLALVDSGRFDFAPIPEHVFVRGRPEKVQMGIWQLDPKNRWTPGDQTRASGWTSNRLTRLVNVTTNQPVTTVGYNSATAEMTYSGAGVSGDVTARIETLDGLVKSGPFRIRVLTPTVVYGANAAAVNSAMGWGAVVCDSTAMSFTACRMKFTGGTSDSAPLVL